MTKNKQDYILTERGLHWLKIDTANTFGLDKLTHDQQIQWFHETVAPIFLIDGADNGSNELINKSDSPFEFTQCLQDYVLYLKGLPVNGMMYVDCSNQALQCYAVLTGDLKTAEVCNMAGSETRADGYQMLADELNKHFTEPLISRALAKKPMMTTLYGKQKAWDTMIPLLVEKLENTDVMSEDFQDKLDDIFNEAMQAIAPNAMDAMAKIQELNDEEIGTYYWTLPDGLKVQYDVKVETPIKAERVSKNGLNLVIEDIIREYKPNKFNAGMAPNVIHSVDAYVCREMKRRGLITSIHDAYGHHYNFIDMVIKNFKDIMIEILESDLLSDIMTEIADGRSFVPVIKNTTLNKFHIRKSPYALT